MEEFAGRLGIVQRVLTRYRVPVFDTLAPRCRGGLAVFAGEQAPWEMLDLAERLDVARLERARNRHILRGPLAAYWQVGLDDWLDRWDPDILVVEANPRCLSTGHAVRWMRARNRPVLGWGWGLIAHDRGLEPVRRFRRRRFPRMFDGMLAYSSRAAAQYRELGFPSDRVFTCKNAAAFRPSGPPPSRPPSFSGFPVVLFVGRLVEAKRVDELMRACASVARLEPALAPDLRIVGKGQASDSLEALARTVYPRTKFLGALHGPALEQQFASADVFVLPGQVGLALQEAMSHGLPVVVGQGDHTEDDLVGPENGWHLPVANAETLAATLRDGLSNVERLRAMGAASFAVVDREVNIEGLVGSFVHALNQISDLPQSSAYRRPEG